MRRKSSLFRDMEVDVVSKIIARSKLINNGTTKQSIALMYLATNILPRPIGCVNTKRSVPLSYSPANASYAKISANRLRITSKMKTISMEANISINGLSDPCMPASHSDGTNLCVIPTSFPRRLSNPTLKILNGLGGRSTRTSPAE